MFRTQDLSQVKEYCIQEWNKILGGKVTVEDFVFAKEVRLGTYRYVPLDPEVWCIVREG